MIVCSLNEVEAYGRRAARGAGMSWGLAEEAGKAARWLSARGLPGVELLLRLLTANDGRPYACMAPAIDGGRWESPDGELCPVCCGAALSDRIAELVPGEELVLGWRTPCCSRRSWMIRRALTTDREGCAGRVSACGCPPVASSSSARTRPFCTVTTPMKCWCP
jgi:hypothetical protein